MSNSDKHHTTIALWPTWGAIVICLGATATALPAPATPTPNLNQQLTIHLNSGTRSPERDQADRLLANGQTAAQAGNLATAIRVWQQAQQVYQQLGDMDGQALAYRYLATAYGQLGQVGAQEDAARRQLATTRDQRDFNGQILANNALGRVLAPRAGGTVAAGTLFMEAMEVASSVRHQAGEQLTATNLTWLANSLDQPEATARQVEMAVLPPSQWMANPVSMGLQLNDRGNQWQSQQRYYMATRFNRVSENLANQSDNYLLQFMTMDDLVVAYRAMGRYDLAGDWLDQRLQLARSLNDLQEELVTLASLGEINLEVGRVEVAQRYFEQAIAVAETLNDAEQTGLLRERLAGFESR
jgi:tetratricopeptide (TPR) repeat protein